MPAPVGLRPDLISYCATGAERATSVSVRRLRASTAVIPMPQAIANAALLIPSAIAMRSSSPKSPSAPELATSTNIAKPTAAPIPAPVDTMPEATPYSRSVTPVAAAINMVVKTTPSPMSEAQSTMRS
jgi:hypothetical protein